MLKKSLAVLAVVVGSGSVQSAGAAEALVTFKQLTLDTALELAQTTLHDCRQRGFQVAVAVVDRMGNLQVNLRDQYAGAHTTETAYRKAWTAVSFRTSTMELSQLTQADNPQWGIRFVDKALMAGGGLIVEAAGSIVAGIGVSGAPGGDSDEACAQVGIESIIDRLEF
ncbi:MAG: heme-binding protein [Rhodospirillales bacterium]|nr:heme-binding protein [Rhodospirillales bacterium]